MNLLNTLLGFVLLVLGAETLVRGGSNLARKLGIPSLVVGLTVVACGTSAPELSVSLSAVFEGRGDIAIGNAVGSNIFNIFAILGISACIAPLIVSDRLVRIDVPIMIASSIALYILALDGSIGRLDGILLFGAFIAYTTWLVTSSKREGSADGSAHEPGPSHWSVDILRVAVGLLLLVIGSDRLVGGVTAIAASIGVSDLVISLTVIAAGTSLPEAATSIVATVRGERDIAVGNVIGSNIFNLLVVIGIPAILNSGGTPVSASVIAFDIPTVVLSALACLPIFLTGYCIERWEGVAFVGYYAAYTVCLIFSLITTSWALAIYAFPLTAAVGLHLALTRKVTPEGNTT